MLLLLLLLPPAPFISSAPLLVVVSTRIPAFKSPRRLNCRLRAFSSGENVGWMTVEAAKSLTRPMGRWRLAM